MKRALVGLVLLGLSGCNNPCQRLCIDMAAFAEECGIAVPAGAVDSCIEEQADPLDAGACRRAGDPTTLRQQWTCDDVEAFFQ